MVQSGKKNLRKTEHESKKKQKKGKLFTLIGKDTYLGTSIAPQECLE